MASSKELPGVKKNDSRHYCQFCPMTYAYRTGLRRHIRTIHEKSEKKVKCSECDREFQSSKALGPHEVVCKRAAAGKNAVYKCNTCSRTFLKKRDHAKHQKICSRYPCGNCDSTFQYKSHLLRHDKICSGRVKRTQGFPLRNVASGSSSTSSSSQGIRIGKKGMGLRFGGGDDELKWSIKKIDECLNIVEVYRATPSSKVNTLSGIHHAMQAYKKTINKTLEKYPCVKVYFNLQGQFAKPGENEAPITAYISSGRSEPISQTKVYINLGGTDCKNRHIFLDFDGVLYFSSGFVSGH